MEKDLQKAIIIVKEHLFPQLSSKKKWQITKKHLQNEINQQMKLH